MKETLLLLAFVPFSLFAQEPQPTGHDDKQGLNVKFEGLNMRNGNMVMKKGGQGYLEINSRYMCVSGPVKIDFDKKDAVKDTSSDWKIIAWGVNISNASNPVSLRADVLK
jgi:hypothetical protein